MKKPNPPAAYTADPPTSYAATSSVERLRSLNTGQKPTAKHGPTSPAHGKHPAARRGK